MTTMEVMETEEFISSVFSVPKKCYPQFSNFQKQLLSISQRFQLTVEKFHKLTKTKETEDLLQIRQTVKDLADTQAVQVAIFGKFHDEMSSSNLVTTKDSKNLTSDCNPVRLRKNDWMMKSDMHCSDGEEKLVAYVYMVYVDKSDRLQDLAQDIQKEISSLCLPSYKNLLLLVGLDPSLEREDSSMKQFEKDLRNAFHDTTNEDIHGEGSEKEYRVHFRSSSYEDLISSEGELPKLIQTHLEWKVMQTMFDMKKIIESNNRMYRKNSEDTFQGPDAIQESLNKRFMEIFLRNRKCISDALLGNFSFPKKPLNCDKIAQVLLENLAQVMQCLIVDVLATIYGLKEYHLHNMLEEAKFKEECATIIGCCIKEKLLQVLRPVFSHSKSVQLQTMRETLFTQFSNKYNKTILDELQQIDYEQIASIVHKVLEEKIQPVERNVLIQDKLKFEINSVLKQTVASNYKSYKLSPSNDLRIALEKDLLRIDGVKGVMMVCGELQVHCIEFSSVENEKAVLEKIKDVVAVHKYRKNYKIGVITKKPELFYSVGSTLHSPALHRSGTLGGFVNDTDGHLYCLTCAHVVPDSTDVNVEIRGQDNGPITIGRSVNLQVPPERLRLSVDCVDIMAVRVNADQIQRCIPYFKTADGEYGPSTQIQPFDSKLTELHNVYKWGSTTNITSGLLHTGESNEELFTNCCLKNQKYVNVFVEPLPVDDNRQGPFALPGDSGAIICAETIDKIQTIAMIQGGDMSVRTGPLLTDYTIGFYVWCGLDKLSMRSGLNLNLVPFSEQNLQQILQAVNQM